MSLNKSEGHKSCFGWKWKFIFVIDHTFYHLSFKRASFFKRKAIREKNTWTYCVQYCAKVMQTNFNKFPGFSKKFCFKRYFNQISPHFRDTYCFDSAIFRMIICFARWFIPHFRAIICSSRKVAVIFRTIIRSSRKFNLLFINRPRAFLKHSSLTEIPKWPFQLLCTKEAINLLK